MSAFECATADPYLFDTSTWKQAGPALTMCQRCPAVAECLARVRPRHNFYTGIAAGRVWKDGHIVPPPPPPVVPVPPRKPRVSGVMTQYLVRHGDPAVLRAAHAAHVAGDRGPRVVVGERLYQRACHQLRLDRRSTKERLR